MIDDDSRLREKARNAIHDGELPSRRPDRTWGGTGSGCPCTVCGLPVTDDEAEMELEFVDERPGRDDFHVHVRCLAAWEQELDRIQPATPASGAGAPSPPDAPAAGAEASRRALPAERGERRIRGRGRDKRQTRGPA